MEDCLENIIRKNYNEYFYYFKKRTPTKILIKSPSEVITYYNDVEIHSKDYDNFKNNFKPLF